MLTVFQFLYFCLGVVVAVYALTSRKRMLHAFTLAFAVNVFPLVAMPYVSMDEARLAGVPLAYIPIVAAGSIFLMKINKINKNFVFISVLCLLFVFYISFNAFYQHFFLGTIVYYFSWIFNFLLLISTYSYFSKIGVLEANRVLLRFFKVLIIACLIGWFRYFVALSPDANFMPFVNRNGTVVFLVMSSPLLFYVQQVGGIRKIEFVTFWLIIFITLLLMQSRSGVLGFFFVTLFYYARFNLRSLAASCVAIFFIVTILASPIGDKALGRLQVARTSVVAVVSGVGVAQGENDYARYMLLHSAYTIFRNNMYFGAGIGVPNYRAEFREHVSGFARDSKAHNFYLSYLAELGAVGFSLLVIILWLIYRKLAPLNSNYRAFKVSYLGMALMMTMNEYILLPELWFFYGMLGGMSNAVRKQQAYDNCNFGRA